MSDPAAEKLYEDVKKQINLSNSGAAGKAAVGEEEITENVRAYLSKAD